LGTSESRSEIPEKFEMWCWRRMDKVSWTDHVRIKVLQRVQDEKKILQTIRRNANWIGHIFHRNCLLKHATEGKIDGRNKVTVRRRRCKQLLDDFNP
jgi:hypothetical protein